MSTDFQPSMFSPQQDDEDDQITLKRRKKTKERFRVTRACDTCKRKKARCSGTAPCTLCVRQGLKCDYNASYARGRVPSIPQLVVSQDDTDGDGESSAGRLVPPAPNIDHQTQTASEVHEGPLGSSRNSPEPPQIDVEGHYVGPSSGVSFLMRAHKRLHDSIPRTQDASIFTFGDSPMPKYDPSFLVLPTKSEAQALVARYFDFAYPTHRFLHRPTVDKWLEEFYSNLRQTTIAQGDREKRAVLLLIFASSKQFSASPDHEAELQESAIFYGASEHHLAAETGSVRLTSVQARLMQCFYLITQSRINHCWSLFGTTVRLAFAVGLHRKRRRDVTGDVIETEMKKRTFWCAYSLDNYLSAALGRPRSFHNEDIDQELPACANDSEITRTSILPSTGKAQSTMLAPVFHAKLSKIIHGILRDLYSIRRVSLSSQLDHAQKYGNQIREWRHGISSFLDATDRSLLITLFRRQHTVLSLAAAHAEILVYRPFLLRDFANLSQSRSGETGSREGVDMNIERCVRAAGSIVNIIRELCEGKKMSRAFWFTHYYAFCAIVVLYVYIIQRHTDPRSNWKRYLAAAQQCQQDLSTNELSGKFSKRYGVVLDELKAEALQRIEEATNQAAEMSQPDQEQQSRQLTHLHVHQSLPSPQQVPDIASSMSHIRTMSLPMSTPTDAFGIDQPINQPAMIVDTSPGSFTGETTGWGEFDSLVMAGMNDFDFTLPDLSVYEQFLPQSQTWNMRP